MLIIPSTVLVTGCAGFIGMHVSERLLEMGMKIVGIDHLNDYYDPQLKQARLERLRKHPQFHFFPWDINDAQGMTDLFKQHAISFIIHLAAQVGVRYSLEQPHTYIEANVAGFVHMLEHARQHKVKHFIYASSSSVYGANSSLPYSTAQPVDHPVSLYAATKRSNELMAHTYSHLYQLPTTGLRFFTVYGPWGRPDMAPYLFTKAILRREPIALFNQGNMVRDFTYIDDIVEGMVRLLPLPPESSLLSPYPSTHYEGLESDTWAPDISTAPFRIYNIGSGRAVRLIDFVQTLEEVIGLPAQKQMKPMQPGDVRATIADIDSLTVRTGFKPETSLYEGLKRFVDWYITYHQSEH
ncbi:SDR family NAD(P)-dependent oxidoreductase [Marinicrinis sediminis]|uniref:SDR family NAD(P)-dependent oxidoreductase n=1 Tax=Marinicrinis sediminis TaxID=1652465 RepID=A0ABW5RAG4_9BACL